MTVIASQWRRRYTRSGYVALERSLWVLLLGWIMSDGWRSRFKFNPLKNPSESFMDYLEGYASSLDIYPTCGRRELSQRDIDTLAEEFWQIARDFSASVAENAPTSEPSASEENDGGAHKQRAD